VVTAGVTPKFAPLAEFPMLTPPDGTVYQLMEFPAEMAFKFAGPPTPQKVLGVAVTGVGAGVVITFMVTDEVDVQLTPLVAVTV
jgi:hypothetical protein